MNIYYQFDYFCQYKVKVDRKTYFKKKRELIESQDVKKVIQSWSTEHKEQWDNTDWGKFLEYCHILKEQNINITAPFFVDYPSAFLQLEVPPYMLFYKGAPIWAQEKSLDQKILGVVGARDPSSLTLRWLEHELVQFLMYRKAIILSGGARGVDQTSHKCALRAQSPTIAILPSGLLKYYPDSLKSIESLILSGGGTIVSEYWPTQAMLKHHFLRRNQLISKLSDYLLIAEAKIKSGTMVTAKHALESGVSIGVVPGHPYDHCFNGSLELINSGTQLVRDAYDLTIQWDTINKVYGEQIALSSCT